MIFRKTIEKDLKNVMMIIKEAQEYFREMGIDQWQDGYPNNETILNDISNDNSYVLVDNDEIIATAMVSFNKDETYDKIYKGKWLSENDYAVIHRIAVSSNLKGKGIAATIIKEVELLCKNRGINSIKIDTHKENISMQKLLKKNGFEYCGIIYLEDGNERIAFEKLL